MSKRRNWDDDPERPRKRYRNERPTEEEDIEDNLEHLIVKLGDRSTSALEKNLEELVEILDHDVSKSAKSNIIKIICDCVANLPEKTSIYATLVGLLNNKNYHVGGDIIEMLVKCFKDCTKACEWDKSLSYVRFFGDLVNCHVISHGSLMNLFETLVDVTMEDNIPQVRSDFFVYAVLSALPWVGYELCDKKEQDLEQLLNTIDNYMTKRSKVHHTALRVWYSDTPHPQEEYLDCLWSQITKLRSDKWEENHIYRPYINFSKALCEALQHNLPAITIPPHDASYIYPYPKVVFRLFDYTDCPDGPILPGAHSIDRYLIEQNIRWILSTHHRDLKTCSFSLIGLQGGHKFPLEYVLVETILAEIFALPTSKYLEIFYGSLLLKLCKMQPGSLPQVLAQAVEMIFDRLDTMNVACVDRFASWFAYHLSNFQYAWNWDDWSACLTLDPLHPKPKFVRECLLRCMRLSYHQRIAEIVPDGFKILLPDLPEPMNKYAVTDESIKIPGSGLSNQLNELIKNKTPIEEIMKTLDDLDNSTNAGDAEFTPHSLKIDVFLTVLLNAASKSFSHLFSALLKYNQILLSLNNSEDAQRCILNAIYEVWRRHPQLLVVLTDKLLKAGIVDFPAVANWIFSKELANDFTRSYIWEILHSTIRRHIKQVENLQKKLQELKEAKEKSEKAQSTDKDEKDIKEEKEVEPSNEEAIESLEEKVETALSDQKNLFLIVFQHFIMILSEHIQTCEAKGRSFKNHWFRWCIGRLQQVFFEHHQHVFKYNSVLESLLFTNDIDAHILIIFRQFCSLQA